jgi:hypothetical protein
VGLIVAVAAPIVGGDRFRPLLNMARHWTWIRIATPVGSPVQWVRLDDPTLFRVTSRSSGLWGPIVPASTLFAPEDFVGLVGSDPAWIAATAALVAIPLWFIWWRRGAMTSARGVGVLASAAAMAALVALAWPANRFCAAHVLVAAPVAYLAAFLVAPPNSPATPVGGTVSACAHGFSGESGRERSSSAPGSPS